MFASMIQTNILKFRMHSRAIVVMTQLKNTFSLQNSPLSWLEFHFWCIYSKELLSTLCLSVSWCRKNFWPLFLILFVRYFWIFFDRYFWIFFDRYFWIFLMVIFEYFLTVTFEYFWRLFWIFFDRYFTNKYFFIQLQLYSYIII